MLRLMLLITSLLCIILSERAYHANAQTISIETIATDLRNPRGIAVFPDGRLLVAEAGDGSGTRESGGHISQFSDNNADGDFDDSDERTPVMCCILGYNTLTQYGTGQDEVGGVGDVLLLDNGRVLFTQDDPLSGYVPDGRSRSIGIFGLSPAPEWKRFEIAILSATTNAIVYDSQADRIYAAESGFNRISAITLEGRVTRVVDVPLLAHGQQAVPAGLALDPRNGDILVALFSGQIRDYYGTVIAYMPDDARIIRINPTTGEWHDELVGLTTAVDVATDELGNIYVVEMATGWPTAVMPREFPLFDPNAPPDAGGYPRFTGRVTLFPADGSSPLVLADGLDEPTNITYYNDVLYVSVGQGTPGRPIIGPNGRTRITGEIIRISGFRP